MKPYSFATHLLSVIGDLRDLFGHTALSTTQLYRDVDSQRLPDVYRNFHLHV